MTVGIAEIDAVPAARPVGAAFDLDALVPQPLFPLRQHVRRDGKCDVQRPIAVMRGNGSTGHVHRFEGGAAAKQQQHALTADVVGAKALVAGQRGKPQHLLVELRRTVEIIDSYRPQILYFDTGIEEPSFEPYIRRLAAYYYNRAAEWGREVVINYKWDSFRPGSAVLDIERGTMGGIRPDVWQNDTSVSRTSWSWVEGHDYKDASELIQELVDVVAKNGNLLLNVGPRPDGTIPEEEAALLEAVGDWLSVHGEAIYGSSPWVVFGEGPTAPAAGSFTDAAAAAYTAEDIRFTRMTEVGHDYVYGIGLVRPGDGRMRIRGFGSDSRFIDRPIVDVRVLGSGEQPEWTRTGEHLEVVLPESELAGPGGAVVRIELAPTAAETRIDFFHGLNL